jgi:hypothetical protein
VRAEIDQRCEPSLRVALVDGSTADRRRCECLRASGELQPTPAHSAVDRDTDAPFHNLELANRSTPGLESPNWEATV